MMTRRLRQMFASCGRCSLFCTSEVSVEVPGPVNASTATENNTAHAQAWRNVFQGGGDQVWGLLLKMVPTVQKCSQSVRKNSKLVKKCTMSVKRTHFNIPGSPGSSQEMEFLGPGWDPGLPLSFSSPAHRFVH